MSYHFNVNDYVETGTAIAECQEAVPDWDSETHFKLKVLQDRLKDFGYLPEVDCETLNEIYEAHVYV